MEGRRNILYIAVVIVLCKYYFLFHGLEYFGALGFCFCCEHSLCQISTTLSYNYFDEMAQSYCASRSSGWVFSIRRNCFNAPTCQDICANATSSILGSVYRRNSVSCFDAFKVRKDHPLLKANPGEDQPDSGKVNLFTYGYGYEGCKWRANHCGPNYCCCKAFK